MRKGWTGGIALAFIGAVAAPAQAQTVFESHHYAQPLSIVPPAETVPNRPMELTPRRGAVGAGLYIDLSSNVAFDTWLMPLSAGYGVTQRLEIGIDSEWMLRPFGGNYLIANMRLYGRYRLIKNLLALEVALHVPTVIANGTGLEINLPARYQLPELPRVQFYGSVDSLYRLGKSFDLTGAEVHTFSYIFAASASALVDVTNGFYAMTDLGLAYQHNDFGFLTGNNKVVTLGLGGGYQVLPDMFLKAALVFSDLASRDPLDNSFNGFSNRAITFSIVQLLDLGFVSGGEAESEPYLEPEL